MVADSEFDGEAALLATIFLAGHSTAVVKTARLASNGETLAALVADY